MTAQLALYLGVLLLVGGAGVRNLLWPVRLRWLGAGYLLLLAAAGLNIWQTLAPLDALNLPDAGHYLLDISAGRATLWMLLGATLLLASETSRFSRLTTLGAAALTLWGLAGIGHGATHGEFVRLLHALHAGAMALWVAGVLFLLGGTPAQARRFSPWALGCLVTLAFTGLLMALQHAGNLPGLLTTGYGRTLLLKVGLFALTPFVAVLVRRHWLAAEGLAAAGPATGRAKRLLLVELLLLGSLLGVTAHLSVTEPPGHGQHSEK